MKNSLNDGKKLDFSKINIDKILTFCRNHTRYVSAGVLTVILVVVLAVTAANKGTADDTQKKADTGQEQQASDEQNTYEVNQNEELNNLISKYYEYYASGNVDELAKIATPLSDMEKSYIQMMSGYVEGYSDISCYTKKGLEEDSYFVSATFVMKFNGVEGLPGMESFYVRTGEDGSLYIDNLYSSFNAAMKELDTDAEVEALIEGFKGDSDVKELQADFQNRYTEAIAADEALQNMANTVTDAIKNWKDAYVAQQQAAAEQPAEEQQPEEQQPEEQQPTEEQQPEEQQQTDSGLNYLPEGTTLTANDAYNVRASMSETSEKMGTTAIGDTIKVVLSYEEGWTKVEWNDKTGYIKTDLLLNN